MTQEIEIGEQLRSARERMGLEVNQAAERLHVDSSVIESLETGKFRALGAPVFARGHLRRYAELLGEPEADLQAQFAALQEANKAPDLTALPHLPAQKVGPASRWPLILVAIVMVLGLMIWWAMRTPAA
jgi:cytoskeleton protein RodZ